MPLVSGGTAIGVLALSHKTVAAFAQRDLMLMQTIGAQIAAAIDVAGLHERLKRAANTDALTGLHNYRYFYDRLEEEVARAERRSAPLAVAFFDLDKLKNVNDTYGHLAGNEVLRILGQSISNHVRTEDVPARYGGDEFAAILPNTPLTRAVQTAEHLRHVIAEATLFDMESEPGQPAQMLPGVRASVGVASYRDHLAPGGNQRRRGNVFLRLADSAMYRAKANGRNRVEVAEPEE